MDKRKPIVGETLYSLNIGNAARGCEQVLTPVIVEKVGNKYFSCHNGYYSRKYNISNWMEYSQYMPNSILYEKEQDWLDKKEAEEIFRKLRELFTSYGKINFTLEQLRKVQEILLN
jgi:hypothetical protein